MTPSVQSTAPRTCGVQQTPQRLWVFEQDGSGESKIKGIRQYGQDRFLLEIVSVKGPLPPLIDDARDYLPLQITADVVLDFLKHPDLSLDLAHACRRQNIPVVASGKKIAVAGVICPPT